MRKYEHCAVVTWGRDDERVVVYATTRPRVEYLARAVAYNQAGIAGEWHYVGEIEREG